MKKFEKVIIGLDLSKMDDLLFLSAKHLIPIFGIERIYFTHVSKNLILPEEISNSYPDLLAPVDEFIKNEILHEIKSMDYPENVSIEIDVKEGNPMETILRWSKIKDVDLLILGRKKELEGSGSLAKNLAQKSPTSVFFYPEGFPMEPFNEIVVPIDFSSYSQLCLEIGEEIAKNTQAGISCCHLYEVPSGYTKTGKSYKEFSQIMLQNAKNDYEKFIKKYELKNYPCEFILKEKKNEAQNILTFAKEKRAQIIIMGSRGRTDSAAILLGSVAEKVININSEIPVLIMKKKGESMGFMEALFRL